MPGMRVTRGARQRGGREMKDEIVPYHQEAGNELAKCAPQGDAMGTTSQEPQLARSSPSFPRLTFSKITLKPPRLNILESI